MTVCFDLDGGPYPQPLPTTLAPMQRWEEARKFLMDGRRHGSERLGGRYGSNRTARRNRDDWIAVRTIRFVVSDHAYVSAGGRRKLGLRRAGSTESPGLHREAESRNGRGRR